MASINPVSGTLGIKKASHLLRRATFGVKKEVIDQFASKTVSQAIADLMLPVPVPPHPIDPKTNAPWLPAPVEEVNSEDFELMGYFKCWLLYQMYKGGANLTEKMTFFLHTHFTTIGSVVGNSTGVYNQNRLLRFYALGNIKLLAEKICYDNAMIQLLDGNQNVEYSPNENYAREFLELYSIGKGKEVGAGNYTTYTEQDVKAAAKVLSGYTNDPTFLKNPIKLDATTEIPFGILKGTGTLAAEHDATVKTFSAAFQNATIAPATKVGDLTTKTEALNELSQLVTLVFNQSETAKNIARKLYRYFVYYEITPEIETDIITPLAQTLISNNYELKPAVTQLLSCEHFYDMDNATEVDNCRGAIIKSPLEIQFGMLNFFNVPMPQPSASLVQFYETYSALLEILNDQGLDFYEPFDVSGYDAYAQPPYYSRNWISSNYLARRYQFADFALKGLTKNGDPIGFKMDILAFVNQSISNPANASVIVQELVDYLLPEIITTDRFTYFLNVLTDGLPPANWTNEWNMYKTSGNDMGVRGQLEVFINALLQSPEYQLG